MQLYDNPASPFCRKVRALAIELGMMDKIDIIFAVGSPVAPDQLPTDHNPLGKIPCLIDAKPIYDSRVICQYLNAQADGDRYPAANLFDVLVAEAEADGVMEAAVLMVYEVRCREEAERSAKWVEAQWAKIARVLDHWESVDHGDHFHMGQIAMACALGYLDFRMPERGWRDNHPKLAAWYETQLQRDSLSTTIPHA